MDLMINPASPVARVLHGGDQITKGKKVVVNKELGEEMLTRSKFNKPLWVEFSDDYTAPQIEMVAPIEEDNSKGKTTKSSDKEEGK